mgnify:CR=1 FL=1
MINLIKLWIPKAHLLNPQELLQKINIKTFQMLMKYLRIKKIITVINIPDKIH